MKTELIIAKHSQGGEVRVFSKLETAAAGLGCSFQRISHAINKGGEVSGWKLSRGKRYFCVLTKANEMVICLLEKKGFREACAVRIIPKDQIKTVRDISPCIYVDMSKSY